MGSGINNKIDEFLCNPKDVKKRRNKKPAAQRTLLHSKALSPEESAEIVQLAKRNEFCFRHAIACDHATLVTLKIDRKSTTADATVRTKRYSGRKKALLRTGRHLACAKFFFRKPH